MLEKYEKAGRIASYARKKAVKKAKAGMKVIDLIDFVENEIKKSGAGLAFPCTVSINEITSHYTSEPDDDTLLFNGDIVKIDLGAEVDGYLSDTAVTTIIKGKNKEPLDEKDEALIMPGRNDDGMCEVSDDVIEERMNLIEATDSALENVTSILKEGISIREVGRVIQDTIQSNGFTPVIDLTGHAIARYNIHPGLTIPNYPDNSNDYILKEDDHIAIEPFATNGEGHVVNLQQHTIYSYLRPRPLRDIDSERLLDKISSEHNRLPFCKRHLLNDYDLNTLDDAINPLIACRALYPYAIIKERSNGCVSQTEHTIIIEKEGCNITTL
ncbi:MAG: type II methionyl aminopeptidase [Methanosphaera stadtmanae]|jgi:methionyl aminopeptidase|nr:type II methionyl aminopeptidase [Methanosphaera stadtmanae]